MRKIIRHPWISMTFWILAIIIFLMTMPDINRIVRLKGDPHISSEYLSQIAGKLEREYQGYPKDMNISTIAVVFYDKNGFTKNDLNDAKRIIDSLDRDKKRLNILEISSSFSHPELKEYYLSKNNNVLLASVIVDKSNKEIIDIKDQIYSCINDANKNKSIEVYLTGSDLITQDFVKASEDGVKKTDLITIIFIIIVLILVFKSPITPIISLLSVGLSYIISLSIVGNLSNSFDFPISTFTRSFLVVSLFGIGTDYTLLLISRFREELADGKEIDEAILNTYSTAGKTIFLSSLTILFGFTAFSFASFNFFKAMTAIAIGIFVLILVLLTFVPAIFKILGSNLLWPFNKDIKHTKSRLWQGAANISTKYPYVVLSVIFIISIPLFLSLKNDLSFNTLNELNDSYRSVRGFNLISKNFSVGKTFPITIYIKTNNKMTTSNDLNDIEKITEVLKRQKSIKEVYSVTRPQGKKIDQFMISYQMNGVIKGIDSLNDGLFRIKDGVDTINEKLSISPDDFKINKLIDGLNALENGIYTVKVSLNQLNSGFEKGLDASEKVYDGIDTLYKGSDMISKGFNQFYTQYKASVESIKSKFNSSNLSQLDLLVTGIDAIKSNLDNLSKKYPEIGKDFNFMLSMQIANQLSDGLQQMTKKIKDISSEYEKILSNIQSADESLMKLNSALSQISNGAYNLKTAQKKIIDGFHKVDEGQRSLESGVNKMYLSLKDFDNQKDSMVEKMDQLQKGLSDLKSGLNELSGGLKKITSSTEMLKSYFEGLRKTDLFYVPQDVINDTDFKKALDNYMNKDRNITKFTLIIDKNPYSSNAIDIVDEVTKTFEKAKDVVGLKIVSYGVGGISSINHDLKKMYFKDFNLLRLIMLIGIFILMCIISRSLINALFMVGTIMLDYYLALSITELIFKNILKYEALNWSVAFFSFTMLLTLGIDYSVFLLRRFYEYKDLENTDALKLTSANIGHVITSAAIILAGTFAAMIPSGILSLIEVSTCVVIGLILLAFGLLPLMFNALLSIKKNIL